MSGKNYLLDTNIVIGLFANEYSVVEKIRSASSSIFIQEENGKKIDAFAQASSVVECDLGTARLYGKIKSQLKAKGTPIPENDIWIAALAQQHQLILVTRDKHFNNIEVLHLESW